MSKEWVLMELYQALWLSADFESDLEEKFPQDFHFLKTTPGKVTMKTLNEMRNFMKSHPVFN